MEVRCFVFWICIRTDVCHLAMPNAMISISKKIYFDDGGGDDGNRKKKEKT